MSNSNQPHTHDHHSHDHDHSHDHGNHSHEPPATIWGRLGSLFGFHGHSHDHKELAGDQSFLDNEEGIRTVWWALAALTITSIVQIVIVTFSGSVALFADTAHNIGDGLNSIPLLIAFYLARRVATRRYTFGYGKAEDLAGIFIVLSIAFSAGLIFWESFQKLLDPQPLNNLGWVAAAAIIGFLGNEAVALLQIRVGRRIGSAALVADGLHARTDGLTSLAVLLAAGGSWLGFPIVDPIIGLLIGLAILFITKDAAVQMWFRLMDAIEPEAYEQAERLIESNPDVMGTQRLRMRWVGHQLQAEVIVQIDPKLTIAESHEIVERLRHDLFHEFANLTEVTVHTIPWSAENQPVFEQTAHHSSPQPLVA